MTDLVTKAKAKVKQLWKSRTVKANALSLVALAVQYAALNPATFAITAPAQLAAINILNAWLRTKTTKPVDEL